MIAKILLAFLVGITATQAYSKDLALLLQEAERGNLESRHEVGEVYFYGLHVPVDQQAAIDHYVIAADQGYQPSIVKLAHTSHILAEVPEDYFPKRSYQRQAAKIANIQLDPSTERENFKKATPILAKAGFVDAVYVMAIVTGYRHAKEYDPRMAQYWLHQAAAQGHPDAMHRLGMAYVQKGADRDEAIKWLKLASQKGYLKSIRNIGAMYYYGESVQLINPKRFGIGLPQDYARAKFYMEIAARRGYYRAYSIVANMYEYGWGTRKDYIQAYVWRSMDTVRKDRFSDNRESSLETLAESMTQEQILKAQALVRTTHEAIQEHLGEEVGEPI